MQILPYIPPQYKRRYPFNEMQVGSTFLVDTKGDVGLRRRIAIAAYGYFHRTKKKMAIRKLVITEEYRKYFQDDFEKHLGKTYIAVQRIK